MNTQQAVVGIYLALEKAGATNLVARTRKMARAGNLHASNGQISAWLCEFTKRHGETRKQGADGKFTGARTVTRTVPADRDLSTERTVPVNRTEDSHATKVSLFDTPVVPSSSSLRSSSSSTTNAAAPPFAEVDDDKKQRRRGPPTAIRLPLERAENELRGAILRALWQHIGPSIPRTTSFTDWRARNSKIALSFARAKMTPEHAVKFWQMACHERGQPIRELSIVQRYVETFLAKRTAEREQEQARQRHEALRAQMGTVAW